MSNLLDLLPENKKIFPPEHRYMVLDVETRRSAQDVGGWGKKDKMGVSVAVLYDSADDSYTPYAQDELSTLFTRLLDAKLIIGFNISGFDYGVLQPFAEYDLKALPTLDMLEHVRKRLAFRVSLDNIATATLGVGKNADGLQALIWWQQGRLDDITKYCQQDVDVTRQIYLYGLEHGHLFFADKFGNKKQVLVDFRAK